MAEYVLQIRLAGYAKEYLRGLVYATARRFAIRGVNRNNAVPHVTLYGPFKAKDEGRVLEAFVDAASRYRLLTYRVRGFNHYMGEKKWLIFNQEMKVLYLEVEPSHELGELRQRLSQSIGPLCDERPYETKNLHAVLPFKRIDKKFDTVWSYLKQYEEPNLIQRMLKIIVLKNGRMLCEYDITTRRLIARDRSAVRRDASAMRAIPPILPRRRRRMRQTRLVEPAVRPWIHDIVQPVIDLGRGEGRWIPDIVRGVLAERQNRSVQKTLTGKSQALNMSMLPIWSGKRAPRSVQTRLEEPVNRRWIPSIIMPLITRKRRPA